MNLILTSRRDVTGMMMVRMSLGCGGDFLAMYISIYFFVLIIVHGDICAIM